MDTVRPVETVKRSTRKPADWSIPAMPSRAEHFSESRTMSRYTSFMNFLVIMLVAICVGFVVYGLFLSVLPESSHVVDRLNHNEVIIEYNGVAK